MRSVARATATSSAATRPAMTKNKEIHGLDLEQWYAAYKLLWKRYHALKDKLERFQKDLD